MSIGCNSNANDYHYYTMTRPPPREPPTAPPRPEPAGAMRIRSRELFKQAREVLIEHDEQVYRLRITHQNKLILTK